MGNGYFRTSQTRKDKRKTKEFTYNYVDRIRLAESSLQDHPNYPIRASGWRHTSKSISHLDLATSCHSAASGINHWTAARQLRPSRSLDYNHINRCKDALDIAEYYWRIDPEEHYNDEAGGQQSGLHQHCQYKEALYRDYADENYHSTNSIYNSQAQQPTQQQQQQLSPLHHTQQQQAQQQQPPIQPFDVGNDSCSLRRSRSLAVIREETFSDLQITSTNSGRRRSQLIPRARLVNRGFFREHDTRFNCANNKHHHRHHSSRENLTKCTEADLLSNGSGAGTCDSHQQQHHLKQQHQQQQQHHHHHHHGTGNGSKHQSREADDYYDNLKRLDAVGGIVAEHLHPWHNDKSDLESLNSDYFKNSLHQSHEHKQHYQQQLQQQQIAQQQQHLKAETNVEKTEKPRIYQSRRQQRTLIEKHTIQQQKSTAVDSCPENSQSSLFPETTTSNSDDQTDSLSLSEQEYDLTRIEEIFQQTQLDAADIDAESYELISLTTTTRTRIDTTDEEEQEHNEEDYHNVPERTTTATGTTTDTEVEGTLKRARALSENLEKLIAYDSVYLSSEEGSEGTLIDEHCEEVYRIQNRVASERGEATTTTLLHISIEDTVFDSPLVFGVSEGDDDNEDDAPQESKTEITNDTKLIERSVPTSIKVNEEKEPPEPSQTNCDKEGHQAAAAAAADEVNPIYTQILKVEHSSSNKLQPPPPAAPTPVTVINTSSAATKPRIQAVVEKRKLKRAADTTNEHSGPTPCLHLTQRPVAEALFAPIKPNLIDNQYHSLPDVNIGKSLKVSERIDAKLRSSYNLNKYQVNEEEINSVGSGKEANTTGLLLDSQSSHSKFRQRDAGGGVTTAEIYDSIKRFGRAHQKARQREYQDLQETTSVVVVKETSEPTREKKQKVEQGSCKDINAIKHVRIEQLSEQTEAQKVINEEEAAEAEQHEKDNEHLDTLNAEQAETEVLDSLTNEKLTQAAAATEQIIETDADYLEQPREAPSIEVPTFTREIEQRAKELKQSKAKKKRQRLEEEYDVSETFTSATFRINKSKNNVPEPRGEGITNPFKIIVTDAQNNVIEEDSIEGNHSGNFSEPREEKQPPRLLDTLKKLEKINLNPQKSLAKEKTRVEKATTTFSHNHHRVSSIKRVPSKPKRQIATAAAHCSQQQPTTHQATTASIEPPTTSKSKERRVLSTQIYKARPVKVLSSNDSFRRAAAAISCKMSRPQILHVVDNKRNCGGNTDATTTSNCGPQIEGNQVENEYMKKVDSVRCYWSKLAQGEQQSDNKEKKQKQQKSCNNENLEQQPRHFNLTATNTVVAMRANKNSNETTLPLPPTRTTLEATKTNLEEFYSLMPSIEIVELNGEKRATIVSAVPPNSTADTLSNEASGEPQFDHIRYKVMKSQQLIRSNILARNKKEAQFDGLIQYLQEYSFQELLSNNNVVIVEPVRTKIERPLMTTAVKLGGTATPSTASTLTEATTVTNQFAAAVKDSSETETLTNGAISPAASGTSKQSNAIKRHFFYQPVRVNRELYEEELPNPDTVRNVRRFFEEHILPTPGRGITVRQDKHQQQQLSPRTRRARKFRYLTIDTSYGGHCNAGVTARSVAEVEQQRKWETASLSSGISSGDLSSPCDCTDGTSGQRQNHVTVIDNDETKRAEELKGVHVQDFIRRHNNDAVEGKRVLRPRPRSVYGTIGEHSHYRDIYEYNIRQSYETNGRIYARRRSDVGADGGNDMFATTATDDVVDDDDDANADGDNIDDDELSESYYVSNDVLEKIRECGSSVTYYGGRVLQRISPEPHNSYYHHSTTTATAATTTTAANCGRNSNQLPASTAMTLTKALVKEFESCGTECQTKECPHSKQINAGGTEIQKQLTTKAATKTTTTTTKETVKGQQNDAVPVMPLRIQQNNHNNDAYLGVRFKLIKSNSCSSRLELAGAEDDGKNKESTHMEVVEEPQQDTEVVKDIVKRLEATRNTETTTTTPRNNPKHENRKVDIINMNNNGIMKDVCGTNGSNILTINNQMPAVRADSANANITSNGTNNQLTTNNNIKEDITQVTVNNHINVPISVFANVENLNKTAADTPRSMQREKFQDNDNESEAHNFMEKTYQSSAMGIRLDMPSTKEMPKDKCQSNNTANARNNTANDNENANAMTATTTTKISRNKNVDLAFTMTKQQQQQNPTSTTKSIGMTLDNRKSLKMLEEKQQQQHQSDDDTPRNTTSLVHSHNELKDLMPNVTKTLTSHLQVSHNKDNNNGNISRISSSNNNNNNNQKRSLSTSDSDDSKRIMGKSQKNLVENFENAIKANTDKSKLTNNIKQAAAGTTIIVPVEIHQHGGSMERTPTKSIKSGSLDKTSNLSCCSSTASIDKTFVRHYVANDKSLFEVRKYDDIEFEEFEVYDPTKDNENHQNGNKTESCSTKQEHQLNSKSKTSSMSDLSSLNDDVRYKSDPDCYDSLDDRL